MQRTLSDPDYGWAPVTGATTYAVDGLNRVTTVGGVSTAYDARQNLTQAPGTPTTVYDALNQLWYAATTRIWYEPLGRLYLTYDYGNTADHRYHAYDGQQRVTDYDGNTDALLRRHVPGAGLDDVVATVAADGSRTWLTGDERGSVMALSNGSGAVTQVNAWDEYGVPRPGNAGTFQYTGQVWLGFAGMQHSRARAYDPSLGRFRQTDPIGYAAGANLYAYVGADPVNWTDPMGLDPDGVELISEGECLRRGGTIRRRAAGATGRDQCVLTTVRWLTFTGSREGRSPADGLARYNADTSSFDSEAEKCAARIFGGLLSDAGGLMADAAIAFGIAGVGTAVIPGLQGLSGPSFAASAGLAGGSGVMGWGGSAFSLLGGDPAPFAQSAWGGFLPFARMSDRYGRLTGSDPYEQLVDTFTDRQVEQMMSAAMSNYTAPPGCGERTPQ